MHSATTPPARTPGTQRRPHFRGARLASPGTSCSRLLHRRHGSALAVSSTTSTCAAPVPPEAAAVTSGAVALVLQRYPDLTPDQVKQFIERDAPATCNGAKGQAEGAWRGSISRRCSRTSPQGPPAPVVPGANSSRRKARLYASPPQYPRYSTGTGSLEAARGSDHGQPERRDADRRDRHLHWSAVRLRRRLQLAKASGDRANAGRAEIWNGQHLRIGQHLVREHVVSSNTWSGNSVEQRSTWSGNTWSGNTWSGEHVE